MRTPGEQIVGDFVGTHVAEHYRCSPRVPAGKPPISVAIPSAFPYKTRVADVAELVDALDLGSPAPALFRVVIACDFMSRLRRCGAGVT